MKITKVIAIQNYGISGTTLIHSLLDDHSQIISIPMLYALPIYQIWEGLQKKSVTKENIISEINIHLAYFFDVEAPGSDASLKQLGELMNEKVEINKEEFFSYLFDYLETINSLARKDFLIGIFLAYNLCFKRKFDEKALICFPIHSQEKKYAQYLLDDFQEVNFIHMIREPVQNMGSLIKHINVNQMKASLFKSMLTCAIMQLICEKQMHWHQKFVLNHGKKPFFPDKDSGNKIVRSRYIRLEDCHKNPKFVLESLSDFLKINWEDCLLKTTFMGKLWHNRAEAVSRKAGFDQKIISQKHGEYLTVFDKYRLRLLSKTEQHYFSYYEFSAQDKLMFAILPLLMVVPFKADFNFKRLKTRINAMLRKYSDLKTISIYEWILNDELRHTIAGAYVSEDGIKKSFTKKTACFVTSLPFFILRIVLNYFTLRLKVLEIWIKRLNNSDHNSYVKPLYDVNFSAK